MIVETKKGKLPVRYGMNALANFGDLTGKSMNEVLKVLQGNLLEMSPSEIIAFVYSGFVEGARWNKEECKVESKEEVGDMIDEDADLMNKIFQIYIGDSDEAEVDSKKK